MVMYHFNVICTRYPINYGVILQLYCQLQNTTQYSRKRYIRFVKYYLLQKFICTKPQIDETYFFVDSFESKLLSSISLNMNTYHNLDNTDQHGIEEFLVPTTRKYHHHSYNIWLKNNNWHFHCLFYLFSSNKLYLFEIFRPPTECLPIHCIIIKFDLRALRLASFLARINIIRRKKVLSCQKQTNKHGSCHYSSMHFTAFRSSKKHVSSISDLWPGPPQ